MHLFIPTCTIEKQNPFANLSSKSFELLLILNFSDIVLPTWWNLFFFLYFPTNVIFLVDDDDEVWDFASTATLLMVKSGDKSFCSTDCNLLVCFWPFDEEMELWVKECAEDGCSVGLYMNLRALGPATWVSSSGKKHPTTSITPFETFNMSQAQQIRWKVFGGFITPEFFNSIERFYLLNVDASVSHVFFILSGIKSKLKQKIRDGLNISVILEIIFLFFTQQFTRFF